jgi:hypothetical protein
MKIVYSVIEAQTNDNGSLCLFTHGTYKDLARAKEKFATLYRNMAHDGHIATEFSSAIMDRQFTQVPYHGDVYKLVRLIETEVI